MSTDTLEVTTTEVETISNSDAASLQRQIDLTLGDLIREGSKISSPAHGWGSGDTACALSAAGLALKQRGYVE